MGIFSRLRRTQEEPGWMRRWVMPRGQPDPKLEEIKRAALADVERMEQEDRTYFRHDGPGNDPDEL
jgi:hypothetical protein